MIEMKTVLECRANLLVKLVSRGLSMYLLIGGFVFLFYNWKKFYINFRKAKYCQAYLYMLLILAFERQINLSLIV